YLPVILTDQRRYLSAGEVSKAPSSYSLLPRSTTLRNHGKRARADHSAKITRSVSLRQASRPPHPVSTGSPQEREIGQLPRHTPDTDEALAGQASPTTGRLRSDG